MRIFKNMLLGVCLICSCGVIEDSQDIPEPGTYTSVDGRDGYGSRLTITKKEKGYDIQLVEFAANKENTLCIIKASGKKSSYGIWVEVPAYGPRLPIIIRKVDNELVVSLKGPDDPKETFTYCLSDRTPVGVYRKIKE